MQVGCLHIAEYPAWVRQRLAPSQPMAGVYARGCIVSCSPALRAAGLQNDERLDRARMLFPRATFHERDVQLEETMWEDVLMMLNGVTPDILSIKPGWALFTPLQRDRLVLFARSITASVGIAPRRLTAMIAALQAETGDVLDVPASIATSFLNTASARHLADLDFDVEIIEKLELFGLRTFGAIARLTKRQLHAQFGGDGKKLYALLHPPGEEQRVPAYQPPPTATVEHEFDPPAREPGEIMPVVKMLIQRGVDALGGLHAQRMTIRMRGPGAEGLKIGSRVLKAPTAKPHRLYTNAEIITRSRLDGAAVESMSIELGGLMQPPVVQCSLFHTRNDLFEAVRRIHKRFPGVLLRAILVDPDAYIPEEGVRYEPYPEAP